MTKQLIPCVLCDKVATHTIQPDGGSVVYYCTRHFNLAVKELQDSSEPRYRIEHGTMGYTVRILEKHWSGAASYVLPRTCDTEQEAIEYAEEWFAL